MDGPQVLAIALYLRDLAGVAQTAPPSELPQAAPSVAAHGTVQAAPEVAAQWNAWWTRALLSAPHRAVRLRLDVVPVAGDGTWTVRPAHVLVSAGLLDEPELLVARLRPVVESLA